jgi:hypothetical protein
MLPELAIDRLRPLAIAVLGQALARLFQCCIHVQVACARVDSC